MYGILHIYANLFTICLDVGDFRCPPRISLAMVLFLGVFEFCYGVWAPISQKVNSDGLDLSS